MMCSAAETSLWITCPSADKVLRVDPRTNLVDKRIDVAGNQPEAIGNIAFGDGSVWVSAPRFPITRINPATAKVAQQFAGKVSGRVYKRIAATLAD